MGLVDLFRPKWKHSDVETRAAAVRQLGQNELEILRGVARDDDDAGVRRIAIKKLDDPLVLREIAQSERDETLRQIAEERASALLSQKAREQDGEVAMSALAQITDQRVIAEVAMVAAVREVRDAAMGRLSDPRALADVARSAKESAVRVDALRRVSDPAVLRGIALAETHKEVALAAVEQLVDEEALKDVVRKARCKAARTQARKKLEPSGKNGGHGAPAVSKKLRSRLEQLCQTVELLAQTSSNFEAATTRVEECQAEWSGFSKDETAPLEERFEAACARYFERLTTVRRTLAERAQEEQQRNALLSERVALCEAVERLRSTDAEEKLGEQIALWDALAVVPSPHLDVITARFQQACAAVRTRQADAERSEAARGRLDELAARAEALLNERGPRGDVQRELSRLRDEWQSLARSTTVPEELERRFAAVGPELARRQAAFAERKQKQAAEKHAQLVSLCEQLERAASSDSLKQVERLRRDAQSTFKRLSAAVPREAQKALAERFAVARDQLQVKLLELQDAEDWKRWANVPKLEALCAEAKALLEVPDLKDVAARLRKVQAAWKQTGPAPKDRSETLWAEFKETCDKVHERCKEHFDQVERERDENLKLKEELCVRVEALQDSPDFEETAERIKQLQAEWKSIGAVPRAKSDAIWGRFRTACDHFFGRRQGHLEETDRERTENLERKAALCKEVEALQDAADFDVTAEKIKDLQAAWKRIGPVPRSKSDAIWARFRKACDYFFDRRQQHLDQGRLENLKQKEALCEQVEALAQVSGASAPSGEPAAEPAGGPVAEQPPAAVAEGAIAEQVLRAREDWKNIGPVPRNAADGLWDRFCKACEGAVAAHPQAFAGTELDPAGNLRRKERLCERIEAMVAEHTAVATPPVEAARVDANASAEEIAEKLRNALAQNAFTDRDKARSKREPDWQEILGEVKRLQSQWKRIGPVPGAEGRAAWERFRKACDTLFDLRQGAAGGGGAAEETPASVPPEHSQNLDEKQKICEEAEVLAAAADPGQHREAVRELRRRWKLVGPVPRAKARRLWNRFRRACNRVMADAKREGEEPGDQELDELEAGDHGADAGGDVATRTAAAQAEGTLAGPATADVDQSEAPDAGWDAALDDGWDAVLDDVEEEQRELDGQGSSSGNAS